MPHGSYSVVALLWLAAATGYAQLGPCTIETVAGGATVARGDGGPALEAELLFPRAPRLGPDGALYFSDRGHNRIRRVSPDGIIETFAGSGSDEFNGDGGAALEAGIPSARALAFAPDGSLYFLDSAPDPVSTTRRVIRRVGSDGVISTIAGESTGRFTGDGGPAVEAGLGQVQAIDIGPDGSVYVSGGHRIRKIRPDGRIETIAGVSEPSLNRGGYSGDGGPAIEAELDRPGDIAVDPAGAIYFTELGGGRVRRILPDGLIDTYLARRGNAFEDGTPRAELSFAHSPSIELDGEGRLYWRRGGDLRRISANDQVETVWRGRLPLELSVTADGRFLTTGVHALVELTGEDGVTTVAGAGFDVPRGDGGPALDATLPFPRAIAAGINGEIFIADPQLRRVRVVRGGRIEAFAGTGESESAGDGGPAIEASFRRVIDVAVGPDGSVFVAEQTRVRRIDPQGMISTYAGDGSTNCRPPLNPAFPTTCGDGEPATEAQVPSIQEIEVTADGVLYIRNRGPGRDGSEPWVRKVTPDGIIRTLSRNGTRESARALGVDGEDLILVFSRFRDRIWRVSPEEEFKQVEQGAGFITNPLDVAMDSDGNLYTVRVRGGLRRVTPEGIVTTIVPFKPGGPYFGGDGGPAAEAYLGVFPREIELDATGDLYIADPPRVRRIRQPGGCPADRRPLVASSGVRNAASGFGFSAFSPGAIISVFGGGLGPAEGAGAVVDDGRLATELAGVRLLVDGVPGALTFVSAGQINGIIPYATEVVGGVERLPPNHFFTPDRLSRLEVEVDGVRSDPTYLPIQPTAPGLFLLQDRRAAALNQDGTLNAPLNPAALGTVVVVFGTGEGLTDPPGLDGLIAGTTLPRPVAQVAVTVAGEPAEALYLGGAPGLVAGVFQANIRIPADLSTAGAVEIAITIGDFTATATVIVGQ